MLGFRAVVAGYAAPVVGPVSFELRTGEVVGLGGPNGVGKTTLFRAITGDARIFSGAVERAEDLQVVHHRQEPVRPAENPLTGRDLLRLTGAAARACPERLRQLLGCRLDMLSGGQLQLMEIWAVLGSPAQLVLLDEPTRHLDREAHLLLAELLRQDTDRRGVLIVSHEPRFLAEVCDRMVDLTPAVDAVPEH